MNGSIPMFPLDALGQQASSLPDSASASGDDAFADSLAAALAAGMPVQQQTATPTVAPEGGLVDGTRATGMSAAAPTNPIGGEHKGGTAAPIGDLEIGANVDPSSPMLEPGDAPPVRGVGITGIEIAPVDVDGVASDASAAAKAGERIPFDTRRPEPVPTATGAGQRLVATMLDHPGAIADDQPADGSLDTLQGRLSQAATDRLGPTSIDRIAVNTPPPQGPAVQGGDPVGTSALRLPAEDHAARSVSPTNPTPRTSPAEQVGPAQLQASAIRPELVSDRPQTVLEQPGAARHLLDQSRHGFETPAQPADANPRPDALPLVTGRPENVSPAPGKSFGQRRGEPTAAAAMTNSNGANLDGFADQRRPVAGGTLENRPNTPSITTTEAGGKSVSTTSPNGGSTPSMIEANLRPSTEIGGFDRLQPALSVEAATRDIERFEPIANGGVPRAATAPTTPSAGMQVAMQIARALPNGTDRLTLQLQPAELGRVDIELNFEGAGRLSALIVAERPETLELLQRDSRFLERSLGDSGLKLASDGLSFALKQDQQQQQQGQNFHEQAQARQAAISAGRAYDSVSDVEPTPSVQRIEGLRLLDIET